MKGCWEFVYVYEMGCCGEEVGVFGGVVLLVEGLDGLIQRCVFSVSEGFVVLVLGLRCESWIAIYCGSACRDGEEKSESERKRMERESPRV